MNKNICICFPTYLNDLEFDPVVKFISKCHIECRLWCSKELILTIHFCGKNGIPKNRQALRKLKVADDSQKNT